MRAFILVVALITACGLTGIDASAETDERSPIPEAGHSTIGYPNVAAALKALRAKPGVEFTTQGGWTIASEKGDSTFVIWSFAPEGYPAYPAAVKRSLVQRDGSLWIEMNVQCEASKDACDNLVRQFQELNARLRESAKASAQTPAPVAPQTAALTQQVVSPANGDPNWRPTEAQMKLVQTQTIAYFAARDGGRLEDAYAKFSPIQKTMVPFDVWRASIENFNAKAGPVSARMLRKVTWYKDPPQSRPGVYAAVDFSSEFANLTLHCGYVVWSEQLDGSFAVTREEDNVLDKAMAAKLKPGDLERIRAQYHCQ